MLNVFFLSYGLVLIAEIAGDKLLYTIGALATRYRPAPMVGGVGIAFALKMFVAVLFGAAIAGLRPRTVAAISAITFAAMAFALWVKRPGEEASSREPSGRWSRAAIVSFAAVFFSEWGDIGQITAATLVAQHRAPLLIWSGATLAMITKAVLALAVGARLRRHMPQDVLRYCGASLLLFMGLLSALHLAQ